MAEQPKARPFRPKNPHQVAQEHAANIPTPWDPADASAFQALARGDCPANLQQRALKFIWRLTGIRDLSYRYGGPEAERDTAFAEGKRFVGLQIAKLLEQKLKANGEQP